MLWSNNLRDWNTTSLICWTKSVHTVVCVRVRVRLALYRLSEEVMRDSAGGWCWTNGSKLHMALSRWTLLTVSHLFKADGFCLNESGVRLLTSNIFYSVHHTPVHPSKDSRRDKPKRLRRQPSEGEPLLPKINSELTSQLCQEEESLLPSSPPKGGVPPSRNKREHPCSTNPNQLSTLSSQPQPLPLLDFMDEMKKLVNFGLKLIPHPNQLKQPLPKCHRAPPPPLNYPQSLQSENSGAHPVHADTMLTDMCRVWAMKLISLLFSPEKSQSPVEFRQPPQFLCL